METIYKQRANGKWEYWTDCDGQTVWISEKTANKMIRQGARLISC